MRLRRASRSKTADRCPLNWVVKFKRRPERRCVGKALRVRLQYALMRNEGVWYLYIYTLP